MQINPQEIGKLGLESLVRRLKRQKRWSRESAKAILEHCHRSGKSRRAFATEHGLPEHRLKYWHDRLPVLSSREPRELPPVLELHPVRMQQVPDIACSVEPAAVHDIELVMPGGLTIRLGNGFQSETLLRALEVVSC